MTEPSDSIAELVHDLAGLLLDRGWSCAAAESCTGGGVAAALTAVAGSSEWFERGFVTYSNESKHEMLGVPERTIARFGAVSEETARAMAEGALRRSRAKASLAVTGVAGPSGGTPDKPVGTVVFAWTLKDGGTTVLRRRFAGGRAEVRAASVAQAVAGLVARLRQG